MIMEKNEENYMTAKTTYRVATCLVVVSIITCVLSLVAIFLAYPTSTCRCTPIDANSVTVTILSIIVALLIGWNIWKTIDSKQELERLKEENEKFKSSINEQITNQLNDYDKDVMGGMYQIMGTFYYDKEDYKNALMFFIHGLECQIGSKRKKFVDGLFSCLWRFVIDGNHVIGLNGNEIEKIKEVLSNFNGRNNIESLINHFTSVK